jgi:hypothetical protein
VTAASFSELKPLIHAIDVNRGWLSVTFVCPERKTKLVSSAKLPEHEDSNERLAALGHRAAVAGLQVARFGLGPTGRLASLTLVGVGGKGPLSRAVDGHLRLQEPATQRGVLDAFAIISHRFTRRGPALLASDFPEREHAEPFVHQLREVPVDATWDRTVLARALVDVLRRAGGGGSVLEGGQSRLIAEQRLLEVGGPTLESQEEEPPPVARDLDEVTFAARSTIWMMVAAIADDHAADDPVLDRWLDALAKGFHLGWNRRRALRRWARCYLIRAAVEDVLDEGGDWVAALGRAEALGEQLGLAQMHAEGVVARARRARAP